MSTTYRIGPAVILTSASVSDPLSDWTEIHRTRGGITVTMPDSMVARGRANEHMAPLAAWYAPGQATVSYKMVNRDIATMAAQAHRSTAMSASAKQALKVDAKLAAITPVSVAIVPLSEYNDDKQFLGAANAVVFEKAIFRVGEMASTVDAETDDLDGYMVTVESVNGVVTVGYPEVGMPELNPQGLLFLWQPSIDAVTPLVGEGAGTFTRATTATYVDDNGVIQSVASGQPRYQDGGLLLEPQRTNLVTYAAFTNALWQKINGATIGLSATDAPDNTSDAYDINVSAAGAHVFWASGIASTSTHTFSFWLKTSTSGTWTIKMVNSGSSWSSAESGATISAANVYKTVSVTGGIWQRVTLTATPSASANIYVYVGDQREGATVTSGIVAFPQLEAGSYPTSYIPTSGSTVTRNADVLSFGITHNYSDDEGITIYDKRTPYTTAPNLSGWVTGVTMDGSSLSKNTLGVSSYNGSIRPLTGFNVGGKASTPSPSTAYADGVQIESTLSYGPSNALKYFNAETAGINSTAPTDGELLDGYPMGPISVQHGAQVVTAVLVTKAALTPAQLRRILR